MISRKREVLFETSSVLNFSSQRGATIFVDQKVIKKLSHLCTYKKSEKV